MQEVDFSDLMGVTPNMGGSGVASSGGGGGGAEETANEIDWISRKLELLEDNFPNWLIRRPTPTNPGLTVTKLLTMN